MNEDERVKVYQQIYDLTVSNNRKDKEIERLGNELQVQIEDNVRLNEYIDEKDKEIERLQRLLEIEKNKREQFDEDNYRLHSIIKEVRDILKFHLSNPSGTKNGWHIDIWNSEDISQLNEDLEILDKESSNETRNF